MEIGWRRWTYQRWNNSLIEHCFRGPGDGGDGLVERIPATPEQLVEVVGDPRAQPREVVEALVGRASQQIPLHHVSFQAFCTDYRGWSRRAQWPPHFFAMLWLTCLVAYGYPDSHSAFHHRMSALFGRQVHVGCLPQLWHDLESWTWHGAQSNGTLRYKKLLLPPEDTFRTIIGHSWFLTFPHQRDRRKLRKFLEVYDLVGEEPPLGPVVQVLERHAHEFTGHFREDLDVFVDDFFRQGADARRSPFWRAVRQEALPPKAREASSSLESSANIGIVAIMEDDELVVFVACSDEARLPAGYHSRNLGFEIDGYSNYVVAEAPGESEQAAMDQATLAALRGKLANSRFVSQARRGVLIFQEVYNGDYRLVGGSEANQAEVALVKEGKVRAFRGAYGGKASPSRLEGWQQVVDARIVVRRHAQPGLEGVRHLQETMAPPSVQLAGGIRTGEGFYAFPRFLPVARFKGARKVEVLDADGGSVGEAERSRQRGDEWLLPESLVRMAPGEWIVRVHWTDAEGAARESDTRLVFVDRRIPHAYKRFGAGRYSFESCAPGEGEAAGGDDIPVGTAPVEIRDGTPPSDAAGAVPGVAEEPELRRWPTTEPDALVGHVADALAALSVRRSGVRYPVFLDLLSASLGLEVRGAPVLFYNVVRGWVEAGAFDIALKQGRKEQYVLARRPGFVAFRRGDRVRASLLGLVPSALEARVADAAEARGARRGSLLPPCRWMPKVTWVECGDLSVLRGLSDDLGLAAPRWLRWPLASGAAGPLDVRPPFQGLREEAPPDSFLTEARWNWYLGRFVTERLPKRGIRVERRTHPERSPIYVVVVDGEDMTWSYVRNWALLCAYSLDANSPIFTVEPREPIARRERADVYLPLPVGHLCAVLGEGLAGPVLGSDGRTVEEYRYPLGLGYRDALTDWMREIGCIDFDGDGFDDFDEQDDWQG